MDFIITNAPIIALLFFFITFCLIIAIVIFGNKKKYKDQANIPLKEKKDE